MKIKIVLTTDDIEFRSQEGKKLAAAITTLKKSVNKIAGFREIKMEMVEPSPKKSV